MADSSTGKKVTLRIATEAYDEIVAIAEKRGEDFAAAVRVGLSLYKVVASPVQEGEKLFLVSADEESEREVVVPKGAGAD